MSYDLLVFAAAELSTDELTSLVTSSGLALEPLEPEGAGITAVRGKQARYCFTVEPPVAVEPEDVPDEVTAVLLDARWQYEVTVEGSSPTAIPYAVRFARRLATEAVGAVLDQQSGEVFVKGRLRRPEPVAHGTVDIVDLHWYVPAGDGARAAEVWLAAATRFLPEALPRRFGPYEPPQLRLDRDGPQAFVDAVAAEHDGTLFKASAPCIEGSLSGAPEGAGTVAHRLTVHRDPLADPRWRDALQRLFVAVASELGAVAATADVCAGWSWNGRSLGMVASSERAPYLAVRRQWAGLPPFAPWWMWFGASYAPLVRAHLPTHLVREVDGGLLFQAAVDPADRYEVASLLAADAQGAGSGTSRLRRLLDRVRPHRDLGRPWLPADLLAEQPPLPPNTYDARLIHARVMPNPLVGFRRGG